MVKQTIQIFARVKPTVRKYQQGIYSIDEDEKLTPSLEIIVPRDLADGFVNNKRESYRFKFQRIFDQDAKQEIIFETIAKPVAESVLTGYNGTIFAYGQTGSGKTFTITGGAERYSDRGIIPRTLSYIFEQLQKDSSKIYTTHISYLEIYNECGYDLLDPRHEASSLEDLPKVIILEDPDQNIHLKNLSLHQATTEEEALNLLFLGDTNRMIAETPMNQASTRSHCIFTVHLSSKEPGSATVRHAKLHLVDLAGSERVSKSGVGGLLLTEAKYINLSLHYLEQVIIALSEKHRSHIPYRNSMMTSVLRDSLGGNCMTTMIATLSLEKRNVDESISTCRFAQRVALIKNEAILNEEIDPKLMIIRLQKEIQELKDELAITTGEQRTEALTEAELLQLEKLITNFLEDQDPESRLEVGADMRKIHHCFHHLKKMLNDRKILEKNPSKIQDQVQDYQEPLKEEEYKKLQDILKQRDNEINILVNMLKKEKKKSQEALHLCKTDRSVIRHSQSSPLPPGNPEENQKTLSSSAPRQAQDASTAHHRPSLLHKKAGMREEMSLGRQEAFEIFKRDHADSITIEDNKQILKQRFSEAKALGESINEARSKIGHLKEEITQRHMQQVALGISGNMTTASVPDALEEKLRAQLEEEKQRYKTNFAHLKALKVEIEHLQLLMDKAKVKLQKEFEAWWAEEATSLQANSPAVNSLPAANSLPAVNSLSAVNSLGHRKSSPPIPEFQQEQPWLLSNKRILGLMGRDLLQLLPFPVWILRLTLGSSRCTPTTVATSPFKELKQGLVTSNWSSFNDETCLMMINTYDKTKSSRVDVYGFLALWKFIQQWLYLFQQYDQDYSGAVIYTELLKLCSKRVTTQAPIHPAPGLPSLSMLHQTLHAVGPFQLLTEAFRGSTQLCCWLRIRIKRWDTKNGGENSINKVYSRKILPSPPSPTVYKLEKTSTNTALEDRVLERPMSSIPLTGDSQTDSDILAFIKARQSILQKKCKSPFRWPLQGH
ncbi:PREDICTED: kinesin-like protein KIF6 [Elephantulus edwardii]|uniref:kinesin-like protein KIF6 n=1 Tax=Elephantulus edwardii TaxID=28737 RepID=UPI0003F0C07A|nr:PREDICTED: kinesin-like protein KIF6 [Elephantulus edwardii]